MKPKHAWNRKLNGTYSDLRHRRNWKKRLSRLRVRRDGSIYILSLITVKKWQESL